MQERKSVTVELSFEELELIRRAVRAHISAVNKHYEQICDFCGKEMPEELLEYHREHLTREANFATTLAESLDKVAE